jgi:hypothetical protein
METMKAVCNLINKGDYMTSIDLQDAFLHVLIHSSSRKYLQFHWKGKQYQFRVLPFGLSLAPFVFTKILKPVLRWARRRGIRISAYLDDLLILAKSFQQAEEATQAVMDKLSSLGFLIKPSKSQLTPTQTITHLGFTIDTKSMTLSVPKDKVRDIRREATKILRKGALTVRALSSFIGKALAMTAAVLPARLRTQHLVQLKNEALRQHNSWTASVSLTDQAKEDLTWWIDGLKSWNGQSWIQQPPEEEVFTDASDAGWGIVGDRYAKSGTWTGPLLSKHINYKELLVVWKVVTHPRFQGKRLLIYCDNTTTLAYVNKFGGTRSPELMELANQIWTHCLATGTTLTTAYIPSGLNPADPPSRQLQEQLEWSISQETFNMIDNNWGPHSIDLFASSTNTKLPRYMSWKHDPMAEAQDALLQPWTHLGRPYICPPWNLIPRVLQKLKQEKITATIIVPNWSGAIWAPTIRNMATAPPIHLSRSAVLDPKGKELGLLSKNPTWSLMAWSLSGAD